MQRRGSCATLRAVAIAPLTRREYRAARDLLARLRDDVRPRVSSPGAVQRVDRTVELLEEAIAEYRSRVWWRRWVPGVPGEHDTPLRSVLEGWAEAYEQLVRR
jgi:hypothetical protein